MQVNIVAHPDAVSEVYSFESNVNYGIDLFIYNYDSGSKVYRCHPQLDGDFVPITYSGWNISLRTYNGWNTDCTQGNTNYVEQVLGTTNRNEVAALFPECA